jgi:hypothetical protein
MVTYKAYFATDFLAVNTKMTINSSNKPKSMNTISTIEKVSNSRHNQIDKAMSAMAVTPNTKLRTLMRKKSVGLPGFIFYLM